MTLWELLKLSDGVGLDTAQNHDSNGSCVHIHVVEKLVINQEQFPILPAFSWKDFGTDDQLSIRS
jgi:hypothetical protein